jgi:hypothetical protein
VAQDGGPERGFPADDGKEVGGKEFSETTVHRVPAESYEDFILDHERSCRPGGQGEIQLPSRDLAETVFTWAVGVNGKLVVGVRVRAGRAALGGCG